MKTLRYGSTGAQVELLQLALNRAGYGPLTTDGMFGARTQAALMRFQRDYGLTADGIAGPRTNRALMPYYTGYTIYTVRSGDTLYKIAMNIGTTVRAIEIANPNIDPLRLNVGSQIVVPLPFLVVPTTISYCSALIGFCVRGLAARFPFLRSGEIGNSVMGKPLHYLSFGQGQNRVLYNASHHANEWITTPVLLKFIEQLAIAYSNGGAIYDIPALEIFNKSTIYIVPAVNPDGIDLVTGDLNSGTYYDTARRISGNYPEISFPDGWKANIRGVDLNLQYPAGWEQAKEIKFAQGFVSPAPRDYVGSAPLTAPESAAMHSYTQDISPALTLSYHAQGEVIYWRFLDYNPPGSAEIAAQFAQSSGYTVEDTPYGSGFAGYKDWFIQDYNLPGYTIEVGLGENPLPISQFDKIYGDNVGILSIGSILTA